MTAASISNAFTSVRPKAVEGPSKLPRGLNRSKAPMEGHLREVNPVNVGEDRQAQQAFVTALDRQQATGARALKADELATIRELVRIYGDLLKEISHRDFKAACAHTDANVQRIIRQRGPKTVVKGGCILEVN